MPVKTGQGNLILCTQNWFVFPSSLDLIYLISLIFVAYHTYEKRALLKS